MIDFGDLKKPFPPESVSWRLGKIIGNKGIALAYIDSRDVQDRLDEVVGPENWQDSYSQYNLTMICRIELWDEERGMWIFKEDGAGATDFEAEKGQISDSFKRAAVKWGIGRYLYTIKSPWIAVDLTDPERPKIPSHELERLMALLPGYQGVTVSPMTGQPKTEGAFWKLSNYNVLDKLPLKYKDNQGDPVWGDPDTIVWLSENFPRFIDKAPSRLHLTKLQVDNIRWLKERMPEPDQEAIITAFQIRATQFEGVKT